MAMRQLHPGPQFALPIRPERPKRLAAGAGSPGLSDVSVCEWTTDLSVRSYTDGIAGRTTVSSIAFVDFDALDSIHESTSIGERP